jgi:hypothetical protein
MRLLSANALDFGELSRAAMADLAPRRRLNEPDEAMARFVGGFADLPAFA